MKRGIITGVGLLLLFAIVIVCEKQSLFSNKAYQQEESRTVKEAENDFSIKETEAVSEGTTFVLTENEKKKINQILPDTYCGKTWALNESSSLSFGGKILKTVNHKKNESFYKNE